MMGGYFCEAQPSAGVTPAPSCTCEVGQVPACPWLWTQPTDAQTTLAWVSPFLPRRRVGCRGQAAGMVCLKSGSSPLPPVLGW